jgi:hypothetical protein
MPYDPAEIVARYAEGAASYPTAAMRLVDRRVRDAHHRQLLGASEDEDEG